MYAGGGGDVKAGLAELGLPEHLAGHFGDNLTEVWPENWQALELFDVMSTQWRVGMSGATGLDFGVLYHKMDRMGLTPERYAELENEIRVMEQEALLVMAEKAKR